MGEHRKAARMLEDFVLVRVFIILTKCILFMMSRALL